jgi:hypothetical protein
MQINKAALAAGDQGELLKLARSIKASAPRDRNANPMTSQFFDPDPSNVRPLDTSELIENSAGAESVEHFRWVEAVSAAGYSAIATHLDRPSRTASVTQIGLGGTVRSGWTPEKPITVSGSEKVLATKLQKAFARLSPDQRAAFDKGAAPFTAADTGVLVESLKAIVYQLLGVSAESLDPAALKVKLAQAIKAAQPAIRTRLTKALGVGIEPDDPNISLAELIALGAKVEKQGSRLHISV